MLNNPFLSETFTAIWCKHFAAEKSGRLFGFLPSLGFTKNRFLPLYTNIGKSLTKGVSYRLDADNSYDYKKKAFLIYDVPNYFEVSTETSSTDLGFYRSTQYPGYLIDLKNFKTTNDYLAISFSKSSRYKLKKYKKRFETSFDVRYVMYRGEMGRETYDHILQSFRELLEKRFEDKQITNNNLDPNEWQFYHEVTYPMLLEGTASLFVIYNGDNPIGVTLNFLSEDILFDAITVFDIDYAKFHLGSITIMGLLDWCLENNLNIFDFSKGYFDYKTRWATTTYDFEYHIYYDTKSKRARSIAFLLKKFFDLKQRLREKNVNDQLHRITYRFKNKTPKPLQNRSYTFAEMGDHEPMDTLNEIALEAPKNRKVRLLVFEYLYLNDGHYKDVQMYASKKRDQFYLICKTKRVLATLQ